MSTTDKDQTLDGTEETLNPDGTVKTTPTDDGSNPEDDGVDYKKKFSESKEEGIRLLHDTQEKEKKIAELETKLADKANEPPSDDELSKDIPEWDNLTDGEKIILRNQSRMDKEIQAMKNRDSWSVDLAKAKSWAEEKGYSFEGRQADFKKFCESDENKGIKNIVVLTKSFLFEEKKADKKPGRAGAESPTGGGADPTPKKGMITPEEAEALRNRDSRAYKKMLLEGRIKSKNIQE